MKNLSTLRKELEGNRNKSLSRIINIEKAMEAGNDTQALINEAIEAINMDIKATYEVIRPFSELLMGMEINKRRTIKNKFLSIDKRNLMMREKLEGMQTKQGEEEA